MVSSPQKLWQDEVKRIGWIATIKPEQGPQAMTIAKVCSATGVALEILLRDTKAWGLVSSLRQAFPDLNLGVGTVLKREDLQQAKDLRLNFAVSPGLQSDMVIAAQSLGIPYLPGVMTPSDCQLACSLGLDFLKFFPASAIGLSMIEALGGPFPHLSFCVAGGIQTSNAMEFAACSSVAALSGSWLFREPEEEAIQRKVEDFQSAWRQAKARHS